MVLLEDMAKPGPTGKMSARPRCSNFSAALNSCSMMWNLDLFRSKSMTRPLLSIWPVV